MKNSRDNAAKHYLRILCGLGMAIVADGCAFHAGRGNGHGLGQVLSEGAPIWASSCAVTSGQAGNVSVTVPAAPPNGQNYIIRYLVTENPLPGAEALVLDNIEYAHQVSHNPQAPSIPASFTISIHAKANLTQTYHVNYWVYAQGISGFGGGVITINSGP